MNLPENVSKVNNFLNATGPPRLFFFYRCPYERVKDSKEIRPTSTEKELVMNFGKLSS